ncbi:uncharacterized protein LOC113859873 [Abrus precatorius]|uniref:Uncharacterized protein LOC113859873 n=1 Tax=Abrus precatorius TaxID=3816 RepID=A0A8B8KWK3_ABRPR|nr:uncharacterized protein LOC113859873 [Abrus precatorius]
MADSLDCRRCGEAPESIVHVLRDYFHARKQQGRVKWIPPSHGHLKINVDGSVNADKGLAGFGGLILNDKGSFIAGFHGSTPPCTPLVAELWAIFWGVTLVKCKVDSNYLNPHNQIRWYLPPARQFKLNVDGSVSKSGLDAGCGGLIKDAKGDFVIEFQSSLEPCSPLTA